MLAAIHVIFGTVALIVVPAALFARKGGDWHKRWGIAFTASMAVVLLSAGFLWQAKGHLFLVPLGAISAYLIFSGWRNIARNRRRRPDPFDDRVDMLAAFAVIAAGLGAAYLGVAAGNALLLSIRPALIGIGSIAICFGANELLGFRSRRMRSGWLLGHFSAMLAAYVSATTAFLVINAHHAPMMLRWIGPSAAGAATIVIFSVRVFLPAWRANVRTWTSGARLPSSGAHVPERPEPSSLNTAARL